MAITFNIPEINWVRVQDSIADIVPFGSFTSTKDASLKFLKAGFFKNDCNGLFRLRIHTTKDKNTIFASSNWIDISQIDFPRFIGNLRFDFNKCVLQEGREYWVTAEAASYVRVGDTNYMSWVYDYPFKTNDSPDGAPFDCPIRMEIFHK